MVHHRTLDWLGLGVGVVVVFYMGVVRLEKAVLLLWTLLYVLTQHGNSLYYRFSIIVFVVEMTKTGSRYFFGKLSC